MRQSELFTKTRKEAPKDEVAKNAELLIRAGYINKEMAGVYDFLPLGVRVIKKIKDIIALEMEALGSNEILMSSLQNKDVWITTDRWSDEKVDVWFKSELKNGNEIGFGWSHEEPITSMMKSYIGSFRDLPRYVHQFQTKMRNETRAKSGIMRCREFVMKDMYSYAIDEKSHMEFYSKATESYLKIFKKLGLGGITHVTSASGGVFTDKFSHEFQTICEAGEDVIYVHKDGSLALNEEIFNEEILSKLGKKMGDFDKKKAAEVGNIFTFGTKKSEELGLYFTDAQGEKKPVYLGSYGIGVTRLMGVLVEIFADDKGLVWPESIAPFKVHLIALGDGAEVKERAEEIYHDLLNNGVEVLFDDREARAGEKFADSDLIGIPWRLIVSDKNIAGGTVEVKERKTGGVSMVNESELLDRFKI